MEAVPRQHLILDDLVLKRSVLNRKFYKLAEPLNLLARRVADEFTSNGATVQSATVNDSE